MTLPLLEVDGLRVEFRTRHGVAQALNGVSFRLDAGEILAVLGESGCGKSVTAQAIMGILDQPPAIVTAGSVRLDGMDLLRLPETEMRRIRGARIAMVFQDALSALNPVATVGAQIAELFLAHGRANRREARLQAIRLLDRVRIPAAARRADDYPHQFSGGMRQRVMIAMAVALDPAVLIADEPTTALDATVQAQVLDLLAELRVERRMGVILVSHDLQVVADAADRIAVMYAGRVVETGPVGDILDQPAHPYTEALLRSVPAMTRRGLRLPAVGGAPPNLVRLPAGCAFHPRCPRAQEICGQIRPLRHRVTADRWSECHFAPGLVDPQLLDHAA